MRTHPLASILALSTLLACGGGGNGTGGDTGSGGSTGDTAGGACYDDRQANKPPVGMDVQQTWGSACSTDEECQQRLGDPDAVCDVEAVIYELPGGFCTKPCVVGDDPQNTQLTFELDDPDCDPAGGVACVGVNTIYSRCAIPCTDDSNCGREGYFCRRMPMISGTDDPTFCLMDDCCEQSCAP